MNVKDCSGFEFHEANHQNKTSHHPNIIGSRYKPTPSKWDDAQKWLVNLSSRGNQIPAKSKPRNSNADNRRLLNSASQRGRDSTGSVDLALYESIGLGITNPQSEEETKKIEVNSICLRDMGTEMTPIASQEPSRTASPLRGKTPVLISPIDSRCSGPRDYQLCVKHFEQKNDEMVRTGGGQVKIRSSLESRALAWDEAEQAKYTARYKREEVNIQAWENHEKRKAEMEMKRFEVKAERRKSRAQEKLANKLAATSRIAEEKRANAEARLNERAARTGDRADYFSRTGRLPFSFNISIKLPSWCR